MTDYFALFEQPRQPWLDPDDLKEKYHRLTLVSHPDARSQTAAANATFAELNKGYRTLSEPAERVLHLLTLEGRAPETNIQLVPKKLEDLFLIIGTLNQEIDSLQERLAGATSALGKSMLSPDLLSVQSRLKTCLDTLVYIQSKALTELQQLNDVFVSDRERALSRLTELYYEMSYLSRWMNQLEEKRFQLSLSS